MVLGKWKTYFVAHRLKPGDEAAVGTAMVAIHEVAPWTTRHEGLLEHDVILERLHQEIDRNRLTKRGLASRPWCFRVNILPAPPISSRLITGFERSYDP